MLGKHAVPIKQVEDELMAILTRLCPPQACSLAGASVKINYFEKGPKKNFRDFLNKKNGFFIYKNVQKRGVFCTGTL